MGRIRPLVVATAFALSYIIIFQTSNYSTVIRASAASKSMLFSPDRWSGQQQWGMKSVRLEVENYTFTGEGLIKLFKSRLPLMKKSSSLSPRQIAEKYGIPETPRSVVCDPNGTTTIGWIPSTSAEVDAIDTVQGKQYHQPIIPRLLFQSWKTNQLSYRLCNHALHWSQLNPTYDYFLFDDTSSDTFVYEEYGEDISSAYGCVKQGSAKCDVWRIFVIFVFGGLYFDFDARPLVPFDKWGFEGTERSVVTGRGCNKRKWPSGCAHQWGLIYAPFHEVMENAIIKTLQNLANQTANHVYDISFWAFVYSWINGPYNSSYMPGWGDYMGGRVTFFIKDVKAEMKDANGGKYWPESTGNMTEIWHLRCLDNSSTTV